LIGITQIAKNQFIRSYLKIYKLKHLYNIYFEDLSLNTIMAINKYHNVGVEFALF